VGSGEISSQSSSPSVVSASAGINKAKGIQVTFYFLLCSFFQGSVGEIAAKIDQFEKEK
jgi:hypothetical protein